MMTPDEAALGVCRDSLEVSARAVGRYLRSANPELPNTLREAGLIHRFGAGFDAESVLAVGRRPFVDLAASALPPDSVLLVHLGPLKQAEPTGPPETWRKYIGFSVDSGLEPQAVVDCYRAWWRVSPADRPRIRAIVAVVATVVVHCAVTAQRRGQAVYDQDHRGYLRYEAVPASRHSNIGRLVSDTFDRRRWPSRPGAVSLVVGGTGGGEVSDGQSRGS